MKLNFKSGIVFSKKLMGCKIGKIPGTWVVMNKPMYLGQDIINLSKIIMYEFHYDYLKLKHGTNLHFCYMDTDLLVYHIKKNKDFYEDIAVDIKARFDTSDYRHSYPLPIGIMKYELGRRIMAEFMALRPKLYAYKALSGSGDKKCKGVKKCIMEKC